MRIQGYISKLDRQPGSDREENHETSDEKTGENPAIRRRGEAGHSRPPGEKSPRLLEWHGVSGLVSSQTISFPS